MVIYNNAAVKQHPPPQKKNFEVYVFFLEEGSPCAAFLLLFLKIPGEKWHSNIFDPRLHLHLTSRGARLRFYLCKSGRTWA